MTTPTVASSPRIALGAWLAAASLLAACLPGCGRDGGADLGAAIDRADQPMLERVGWGVRCDEDLEWLTRLGRGDSFAWEIVIAKRGVLDVQVAFGPGAQATVAVPVEPGHRVHVVFRPRLGESGLVGHRRIEPGESVPPAWTSWGVSSQRWAACLSVLAPCDDGQRIEVTEEGKDRVAWDGLGGQYLKMERPFFRRALGGTEVEGTPLGSLAIPAAARITGQTVAVVPSGSFPHASDPTARSARLPDETPMVGACRFP